MKPSADPGTVRGLLVLAIEVMALASLWLCDLALAAMLQALAVLVLCVDQLDRRLPAGTGVADGPCETPAGGCRTDAAGETCSES